MSDNGGNMAAILHESLEQQTREQRRYEIARDCMAGISTKFSTSNDKEAAEVSVRWADALLAELEKSK